MTAAVAVLFLAVGAFGLAAFFSFARWRQSAAVVRHARREMVRLADRNVVLRREVGRLFRTNTKASRANARLIAEMARKDQMLINAWAEIREQRETVHALTACAAANQQLAVDWAVYDRNTDESMGEDERAELDAVFSGVVSTIPTDEELHTRMWLGELDPVHLELAAEMGDES